MTHKDYWEQSEIFRPVHFDCSGFNPRCAVIQLTMRLIHQRLLSRTATCWRLMTDVNALFAAMTHDWIQDNEW